jgi:uncharacterized membrane protein YccC
MLEHTSLKSPHEEISMIKKRLVIRILWGLIGAIAMLIITIAMLIKGDDWVSALICALLAPIAGFALFYLAE